MKLTNLLTTSIALSGIIVCTSCSALLATGSTSSGSVYTSDGYDYGYGASAERKQAAGRVEQ